MAVQVGLVVGPLGDRRGQVELRPRGGRRLRWTGGRETGDQTEVPEGVTVINLELWGVGGSGADGGTSSGELKGGGGGGGGAGYYVKCALSGVTPGAEYGVKPGGPMVGRNTTVKALLNNSGALADGGANGKKGVDGGSSAGGAGGAGGSNGPGLRCNRGGGAIGSTLAYQADKSGADGEAGGNNSRGGNGGNGGAGVNGFDSGGGGGAGGARGSHGGEAGGDGAGPGLSTGGGPAGASGGSGVGGRVVITW